MIDSESYNFLLLIYCVWGGIGGILMSSPGWLFGTMVGVWIIFILERGWEGLRVRP